MNRNIVFATGADRFETAILSSLSARDPENTYRRVHSATHIDGLEDVCARYRPQVLVISEGLAGKLNFLELVRRLKMTIRGMQIVVLAKPRVPGDAFLTGLVMYGVYDFIASGQMSPDAVADLIVHPRDVQEISAYVPAVNIEQNGAQFSFSAADSREEGTRDIDSSPQEAPLADITDTHQAVNHVSSLTEIREQEDSTPLYTEKHDRRTGIIGIGEKVGYNPLFRPASSSARNREPERKHQQFSRPSLFDENEREQVRTDDTKPSAAPAAAPVPQNAPQTPPQHSLNGATPPQHIPNSQTPLQHSQGNPTPLQRSSNAPAPQQQKQKSTAGDERRSPDAPQKPQRSGAAAPQRQPGGKTALPPRPADTSAAEGRTAGNASVTASEKQPKKVQETVRSQVQQKPETQSAALPRAEKAAASTPQTSLLQPLLAFCTAEELDALIAEMKKIIERGMKMMLEDPLSFDRSGMSAASDVYQKLCRERAKRPEPVKRAEPENRSAKKQASRRPEAKDSGKQEEMYLPPSPASEPEKKNRAVPAEKKNASQTHPEGSGNVKGASEKREKPDGSTEKKPAEQQPARSVQEAGEKRENAEEETGKRYGDAKPAEKRKGSVKPSEKSEGSVWGASSAEDAPAPAAPVRNFPPRSVPEVTATRRDPFPDEDESDVERVPAENSFPEAEAVSERPAEPARSERKKVITFFRDSKNENMVAFNLFADLALKGERCVFVRFGHRNEEDFQFDTLVENGCSVQMMDGPNTLEIKDAKDSDSTDRIIIDMPSSVSVPFAGNVARLSDMFIFDIDQSAAGAVARSRTYASIPDVRNPAVMIAGYRSGDARNDISMAARNAGISGPQFHIDGELMHEDGDDPFVMTSPEAFRKLAADLIEAAG